MSPSLVKAGKSAVIYRINKLVKQTNRKLGAHSLDAEKSVGKIIARRELVGVKPGMWEGEGRDAYHPNDVGASRMASWMREFLRHGTNIMDPDYPPRGFHKRETVGPTPRRRDEKPRTPTVLVPPYWGKTKEKEERAARGRVPRRRDRSEPPRRRERSPVAAKSRSSSLDSECRMDSNEEREVERRARIADESDDGGSVTVEKRTVSDLISLDEDPLEGSSKSYEAGGYRGAPDPQLSESIGSASGSVGSDASRKRRREILMEADEEGMEALEEHWQAGKTMMYAVFCAKKRRLLAQDEKTAARAKKEMARKRAMLNEHMSSLKRLVMHATEYSDSDESSSESSEEDEVKELEQVTKRIKSVREASSRPIRK